MKNNPNKFIFIPVLFIIIPLIWLMNKNSIVINIGIKPYRTLTILFFVFFVVAVIVLSIMIFFYHKKYNVNKQENIKMTEADRQHLHYELGNFYGSKWHNIDKLKLLITQLNDINEYQNNLKFLLTQTKYLEEKPTDIIQQVEDCMYVNIKKLLNYMHVLQQKDYELMHDKTLECINKNAGLLQKAKDFVLAITDYVNNGMSSDDDEKAVDYVNSYMYVVLDAIEKEDIYLN